MALFESLADWQQALVQTNLPVIGYNAWAGYLAGERGAVVCSLSAPQLGVSGETFQPHYVPRSRLAAFLNAWLALPDTAILHHHHVNTHILQAIDTYNPETDAILLLELGPQATFFFLRHLPIAPPTSYEAICKGWEEFQMSETACAQMRLLQIDLTP